MSNENELDKVFDIIQDKLAEGISNILRSMPNREKRIDALRKMENEPTGTILKRVHEIALQKEDYETCEAVKEYSKERGIDLT